MRVWTTAALITFLLAATPASGDARERYGAFAVPDGAFKNELGKFPAANPNVPKFFGTDADRCSAFSKNSPTMQPGLGVPLGGVGAGSFMINQAGSFGPWNFGGRDQKDEFGCVGQYENRILPQAAFHIREQAGDGRRARKAGVKTLAVRAEPWANLPKAWDTLKPGDGRYAALWPFGWTSYKTLRAEVGMRFWSPIVAGNDRYTSTPVAFFDVSLRNPTKRKLTVSTMFTLPNERQHFNGDRVRTGLTSRMERDRRTGVTAVTLSASDPKNSVDTQDTEWTIAAKPRRRQKVSFVTSWNAEGDGSDIRDALSARGVLPNRALDASASAGAVAVSVTLRPGESTTIPLALAWDFPKTTTMQPSWGPPTSTSCAGTRRSSVRVRRSATTMWPGRTRSTRASRSPTACWRGARGR